MPPPVKYSTPEATTHQCSPHPPAAHSSARLSAPSTKPSRLGEAPDPAVAAALRENAFVFSGFKTHTELAQVAADALVDENGNIRPFDQFRQIVSTLNQEYNHRYLRTEYNQAVQSAQMASKWADFERDKEFINLQYRTDNDERVRASHRVLHGVTLPVDDKFWQQYTPPNGWGCRCTVVAVPKDDPDFPVRDAQGSTINGKEVFPTPAYEIFKTNTAKAKKVFPDKHPYLPKGCGNCGKTLLAYNPNRLICKACVAIKKCKDMPEGQIAIVDKDGKKLSEKALDNSPAKGFDFKLLGRTINDKMKELNCNSILSQKIVVRNNYVRLFIENGILTFDTRFKTKDGKNIVELFSLRVNEQWQNNGIGKNILLFMMNECANCDIDKLTFTAKDAGSYAWASAGIKAKGRDYIHGLQYTDERAKQMIDDFYKDNNPNTPFPMQKIAEKKWGKEALMKISWEAEIFL